MSRSLYARLTRRYRKQPALLERREFVKLTLAASAGLLVRPISLFGKQAPVVRGRKVIVIGAGFGGLACAYELVRYGCDVVVLEARNRIGGRVISFTDIVPGKIVEGGGELIGSNHPTWLALAKHFGLPLRDVTHDERLHDPIVLRGRRLRESEAKRLWEEMDHAYKLMNHDAAAIDANEPWKSANAARLDARTTAQWINALAVSDFCKKAMTAELAANNGVATWRQSYLGNLTQVKGGGLEKYWTESEVFRCRGGSAELARLLARAIGSDRVHLQTPVREVRISSDRVRVTTAAGATFEGDEVVLAVPPSTWHNIRFSPALPHALRPQMGVNVKYLATVKRRFWLTSGSSPDAISDGIVSLTWDGTDGQGSDADGAVLMCFSGGSAAERARQKWAQRNEAAFTEALHETYPDFSANFMR
ncbi:MAG: flavin monoamine oxidase family protein, partial [Chthoniobacterales bacterium]